MFSGRLTKILEEMLGEGLSFEVVPRGDKEEFNLPENYSNFLIDLKAGTEASLYLYTTDEGDVESIDYYGRVTRIYELSHVFGEVVASMCKREDISPLWGEVLSRHGYLQKEVTTRYIPK